MLMTLTLDQRQRVSAHTVETLSDEVERERTC
jgi:hypothetical protein